MWSHITACEAPVPFSLYTPSPAGRRRRCRRGITGKATGSATIGPRLGARRARRGTGRRGVPPHPTPAQREMPRLLTNLREGLAQIRTRCRIEKRIAQHHGKDKNSHLFRHAEQTKDKKVDRHSFKIIGQGYRSNFARKISESLYIKKLKPDLNVQKDSYKLCLFN